MPAVGIGAAMPPLPLAGTVVVGVVGGVFGAVGDAGTLGSMPDGAGPDGPQVSPTALVPAGQTTEPVPSCPGSSEQAATETATVRSTDQTRRRLRTGLLSMVTSQFARRTGNAVPGMKHTRTRTIAHHSDIVVVLTRRIRYLCQT